MGSLKSSFTRWHEAVNNLIHRENLLKHTKERLTRAYCATAFSRWKQTLSLRLQIETNIFIESE
jgi:hypothetical protein